MCVPERWLCDGDKDCADGADESVAAGCRECWGWGGEEWGGQQAATLPLGTGKRGEKRKRCGRSPSGVGRPDPCPALCPFYHWGRRKVWVMVGTWAGAEGPVAPSTVYNSTCDDREFMCQNRQCIPKHFVCDHDRDCADGSDESPECGEPRAVLGSRPCPPPNEELCQGQQPALLPQSTRPAAPTSSAAPTGAA